MENNNQSINNTLKSFFPIEAKPRKLDSIDDQTRYTPNYIHVWSHCTQIKIECK